MSTITANQMITTLKNNAGFAGDGAARLIHDAVYGDGEVKVHAKAFIAQHLPGVGDVDLKAAATALKATCGVDAKEDLKRCSQLFSDATPAEADAPTFLGDLVHNVIRGMMAGLSLPGAIGMVKKGAAHFLQGSDASGKSRRIQVKVTTVPIPIRYVNAADVRKFVGKVRNLSAAFTPGSGRATQVVKAIWNMTSSELSTALRDGGSLAKLNLTRGERQWCQDVVALTRTVGKTVSQALPKLSVMFDPRGELVLEAVDMERAVKALTMTDMSRFFKGSSTLTPMGQQHINHIVRQLNQFRPSRPRK